MSDLGFKFRSPWPFKSGMKKQKRNSKLTGHFIIGDRIRQDFCQIQENLATLVQDLDAWFDFEIFAYRIIEGMEGGLAVPEKVGHIQHI